MSENTKNNEEEVMTVCSRIGGDYNPPATAGSEGTCTQCGHKIWISTTTSLAMASRNQNTVKHHCIDCAIVKMKAEATTILPLTSEQKAEINDTIKDRKNGTGS